MKRFYFHVMEGSETICDPEGSEYPDLTLAQEEAERIARDLIAESLREGEDPDGRAVVIADESGATLATISFADVLKRKS